MVQLPPLRERREDIPLLVKQLSERVCSELGRTFELPAAAIVERMKQHDWPGNVRELENELRRYYILDSEYSPDRLANTRSEARAYDLGNVGRETIRKALDATQGNKTKSAELLGNPPSHTLRPHQNIQPVQLRSDFLF